MAYLGLGKGAREMRPSSAFLRELNAAAADIDAQLAGYRFAEASDSMYHAIWDNVADWYVEASKKQHNPDMLAWVLDTSLERIGNPTSVDVHGTRGISTLAPANVEAQLENTSSLLHWTRRLVHARRRHPAFGLGDFVDLGGSNPSVLSFVREFGDAYPALLNVRCEWRERVGALIGPAAVRARVLHEDDGTRPGTESHGGLRGRLHEKRVLWSERLEDPRRCTGEREHDAPAHVDAGVVVPTDLRRGQPVPREHRHAVEARFVTESARHVTDAGGEDVLADAQRILGGEARSSHDAHRDEPRAIGGAGLDSRRHHRALDVVAGLVMAFGADVAALHLLRAQT